MADVIVIEERGLVELTIAFSRVTDSLERFGTKMAPYLEPVFYQMEAAQFESGGRANKWPELNEAYESRRAKEFNQPFPFPLIRTGALSLSLKRKGAAHNVNRVTDESIVMGTDLDYADPHMRAFGNRPARKPIDVTEDDKRNFVQAAAKGYRGEIKRTGFRQTEAHF